VVEFCVQRRGGILVPLSSADMADMTRLPERRIITLDADVKAPAKLKRWYWALCSLLVEATGRWASKEIAHREFMFQAGMIESIVISTNGDYRITPISTAGWEFVEWREYLDRLLPIVAEKYAGETQARFRNRVDAFLGIRLKEAWEET
jgi:hypothetical protein